MQPVPKARGAREAPARPREPRHHRSDRNLRHPGDLAVAQVLEIAQHQRLAERRRDALCIAHLYDDSLRQSRTALELHPNFAVAHYQLGQTLVQLHRLDEAIAEFRKAIALAGGNTTFDSNLAHAYAVAGRAEEATKILKDLEGRQTRQSPTDASIALIHVGLGDNDQAMAWLEKAFQARFNPSILLRPAFDPIRADPRFRDLKARIGLPVN